MSRTTRSSHRDLALAISLALLSSAAVAQGQGAAALEEIVVTAQKRSESLSDVPVAISAVSAEKIRDAGVNNLENLKNYVPSFFMVPNATGNSIAIRGVFSGTNNGFEQSVGTYVDGLYHGRGQQSRAPFLDLERVEVLRGSQSILFGKNSVAGALNVTTARPTKFMEGSFSALYEPEYEEKLYTLVLSGPLTDRLRGRVATRFRDYGGNVRNLTLSRDEANQEEGAIRGWLEFDLTDDVKLSFKAEHDEFDVTGRAYEINQELPATRGAFAGRTCLGRGTGLPCQVPRWLRISRRRSPALRTSNCDFP